MSTFRTITSILLTATAITVTGLPAAAQSAPEVEALRAQVKELLTRIEKLEKAPGPAAGPPASRDAPLVAADAYKAPQVAQSGNAKVKLTISGQVGRVVSLVDDGFDSDVIHADNATASSRIRIAGQAKLDDSWTAGTDIELETSSASSRTTGIGSDGGSNFSLSERKVEFWVQHKELGRLWVGQGDTATNLTSEVDLSGTVTLLGYSDVGQSFGGVAFRNKATRAAGATINAAFNNFDGLHREDRVRYDTPTLGGFQLSASATEGGAADAAVRYGTKIGDTEVAAAIAYADNDSRTGFDTQTNGSVSVKFAGGLNATAAAGTRDLGPRNSDFWYGKVGYTAKLAPIGASSFSIDYYKQQDLTVAGADAKAVGAAFVQTIDAWAADLYLGVRNHSYDTPTADFKDVFGVITGARIRF